MSIDIYFDTFELLPHVFHVYLPTPELQKYYGHAHAWIFNWLWFCIEVIQKYVED